MWAQHYILKYSNNNTLNSLIPPPQPQQQKKLSTLEESLTSFFKVTQNNFQEIKANHEVVQRHNETSMKNMETQIWQLAKKIVAQSSEGFVGGATNNPKNESCKEIELGNKKVLTPVESEVVENERKKKFIERGKTEKPIDVDSTLRKFKSQLLKDGDKEQEVQSYVKQLYSRLSKKNKKEEEQFKKFMKLFSQLQVNISFDEVLDHMSCMLIKFMKYLFTKRRKLGDDENIALSENCSSISHKEISTYACMNVCMYNNMRHELTHIYTQMLKADRKQS